MSVDTLNTCPWCGVGSTPRQRRWRGEPPEQRCPSCGEWFANRHWHVRSCDCTNCRTFRDPRGTPTGDIRRFLDRNLREECYRGVQTIETGLYNTDRVIAEARELLQVALTEIERLARPQ